MSEIYVFLIASFLESYFGEFSELICKDSYFESKERRETSEELFCRPLILMGFKIVR